VKRLVEDEKEILLEEAVTSTFIGGSEKVDKVAKCFKAQIADVRDGVLEGKEDGLDHFVQMGTIEG